MPYPKDIQLKERIRRLIVALLELWEVAKTFIKPKKKGRLP